MVPLVSLATNGKIMVNGTIGETSTCVLAELTLNRLFPVFRETSFFAHVENVFHFLLPLYRCDGVWSEFSWHTCENLPLAFASRL